MKSPNGFSLSIGGDEPKGGPETAVGEATGSPITGCRHKDSAHNMAEY